MLANIIAAGEGTRFVAEGEHTPKPLLKIGDTCMLGRLLDVLSKSGFNKFNIIINEESDVVCGYIDSMRQEKKLNISVLRKSTISSMHSFYELLQIANKQPYHLFTVDAIFPFAEFQRYLEFCKENRQYDVIMAVTPYVDDEKPLYVCLDKGKITSLRDEPANAEYITSGFYYFNSDIMPVISKQIGNGAKKLRNFLRQLLVENYHVGYFEFSKTIDVDHVSDIEEARLLIQSDKL